MAINVKKYTKDQMAKMVEEAQEKNAALGAVIVEPHEHLAISNKAAIVESEEYRENTAKLKADADVLRGKLADTEAALGRANAELGAAEGALGEMDDLRTKLADAEEKLGRTRSVVASMQGKIACANDEIVRLKEILGRSESRANWATSHPWSNLWAWIKRKLVW